MQFLDLFDWIDSAGGEKDHPRIVFSGQLQAVIGSKQIGVDQIIRGSIDSGQCRRFRGTFKDPLHVFEIQIARLPDVSVNKLHSGFTKSSEIEFRTTPFQVVEGYDLLFWKLLFQPQCQVGTNKSCPAGDEDQNLTKIIIAV